MENTKQAADAEQLRADLERQLADSQRQLADAKRYNAEMKQGTAEMKRGTAEINRQNAEMKRQTAEVEKQAEPSDFHQILRLPQDQLFTRFTKYPSRLSLTTDGTEVEGNWRPSKLQRWTAFFDLHSTKFQQLEAALGDRKLFASPHQMRYTSRHMSPNGLKHEDDVRRFVRDAVENPAKEILSHYFQYSEHPTIRRVTFRGAGVGPAPQQEEFEGHEALPNRWRIRIDLQGKGENCFVGEYKVPYELPAAMLRSVLTEHPGDDFLTRLNTSPPERYGQLPVAMALCEAFHNMIQLGVLSGYITTGEAFVFLHVSEADPGTLHYFPVFFDADKSFPERPCEITSVSYLCTFSMFAAERDTQNKEWIKHAQTYLTTWPLDHEDKSLVAGPPGLEAGNDGDDGDDGDETQNTGDLSRRGRSPARRSRTPTPRKPPHRSIRQRPTLPFCTQACLASLCNGTAMDPNCPNAALHSAIPIPPGQHHPLIVAELQERIGRQIDDHADDNCECWDQRGFCGRTAVLFKLTLTGYGYTFVAKGVYKRFI